MSIATRTSTLAALAVLVAGCQRDQRREPVDSGTTGRAIAESPGALATRREAQEALERARLAFERKDSLLAKSELKGAATFLRTEAQQAAGEAQAALRRAADELEVLGDRIAKGQLRSGAALVTASLSVNRTEAAYHLQRAKDALATAAHSRAADELTMTVDHLERAAKDAGRQADTTITSAIANARTLANELMKGIAAVPDESKKVADGLSIAIARLGGDVKVQKEP